MKWDTMIEIKKYTDLSPEVKERLVFNIHTEFGHIPIVNETKWAEPGWTIINFKDGEIATFYNIVEREILLDNNMLKCAGINNVITPEKYRGKGLATATLTETESFLFEDLGSDIGILLCADHLVPFYKRLGWYKVNCPVYFDQPGGRKLWQANTMLLTRKAEKVNPGEIDLQGLPW
jgi:predicted acetyltransferase